GSRRGLPQRVALWGVIGDVAGCAASFADGLPLETSALDSGIVGGNHGSAQGGSHCRDDHAPGSGPDPSTARPTATAGALPVVESGPDAAFEPDRHPAADPAARARSRLRG